MNEKLFTAAKSALVNAYCPYSGYQVGAAVLTEEGKIFSGCNIENASYSVTICAERVALFKSVSEGYNSIKELIVITNGDILPSPCGACRQVMAELAPNIRVYLATFNGRYEETTVNELLPNSFTRENLRDE